MSYKIVSDSADNIYEMENKNYASVPLKIRVDGKEYEDKPGLDLQDMITTLKNTTSKSGTSCPGPADWLDAFGDADQVYAVTITSALSGSYNSAMQARALFQEEKKERRVHVFDSRSAGPEMLLLVEKIQECIDRQHSFDSIKNLITSYQKQTHLLFCLESLTNLSNNGRVNPAIAKIAGILGIQLVGKASEEGTLEILHKCRGGKSSLNTIYKEMKKSGYAGGKVRIGHCYHPQAADTLREMIQKDFPEADVSQHQLTGLCSFYAEKNGLMVGYEA